MTPASTRFWPWPLAWTAIVLLAAAMVATRGINQDSAWHLHMVAVWFEGGVPYIDAVETNPPLIFLLSVPPAWLAHGLGVNAIGVFHAYVFLLALLSVWGSVRLVPSAWPATTEMTRRLLVTALIFLVVAFPKGDFAQREHLAVIGTMPYVLLIAARAAESRVSSRFAFIVGAAGALGFAIKPYFLVAWVALELTLFVRLGLRTLWRPEHLATLAMWTTYGAVVLFGFPQYFSVAEIAMETYSALNSPAVRLVQLRELQTAVIAAALVVLLNLKPSLRWPLVVVGIAAGGFLVSSLIQLKGWGYHMLPPQTYLALMFVAALVAVIESGPVVTAVIRGGVPGVVAAATLSLLLMAVKYVYEAGQRAPNDPLPRLVTLVRTEAPQGPIAILGMRTIVYPAFPLINITGAKWSLKQHSLWFLPGLYERELNGPSSVVTARRPEAMPPRERELYEQVITDLCATPPRLLLFESVPHLAPAGRRALDLVAYYRQDSRFDALFGRYQSIEGIPPYLVYKSDAPSCD